MSEKIENGRSQVIELTAHIVSAYVSKNAVPMRHFRRLSKA
ncbi:hypothetical protein MJ8_29200 [Mesorhizobium sp. J8]|nr:hypothetical protein MJ8_29200 [Mesorhizobium sp. J8]